LTAGSFGIFIGDGMAFVYLAASDLIKMNEVAVLTGGGTSGVQSPRALEVVITQPQQSVFGQELYPTLWLKAAYILHQIVKTPVFVDGSKRTAQRAVTEFLKMNGASLSSAEETDLQDLIYDVTTKANTNENMQVTADWLATHVTQSNL
jgi:death-on-curing protein